MQENASMQYKEIQIMEGAQRVMFSHSEIEFSQCFLLAMQACAWIDFLLLLFTPVPIIFNGIANSYWHSKQSVNFPVDKLNTSFLSFRANKNKFIHQNCTFTRRYKPNIIIETKSCIIFNFVSYGLKWSVRKLS